MQIKTTYFRCYRLSSTLRDDAQLSQSAQASIRLDQIQPRSELETDILRRRRGLRPVGPQGLDLRGATLGGQVPSEQRRAEDHGRNCVATTEDRPVGFAGFDRAQGCEFL